MYVSHYVTMCWLSKYHQDLSAPYLAQSIEHMCPAVQQWPGAICICVLSIQAYVYVASG